MSGAGGPLGKEIPRHDGLPRVTGEARYTADLKLPGALVGKLARSTFAHARIRAIDTRAAEALPGVKAVLTGADLPVAYGILPASQDEHALAVDKARYVGDPVAAVAAVDEATALAAVAALRIEYEPLPAVLDLETALKGEILLHEGRGTNVLREVSQDFGDVDGAFAEADLVLDRTWLYGASTHVPLEPHAALASWEDGRLTLRSSTQVPHYLQRILAQVLQTPVGDVRVIKPFVGAAYGGKSEAFSLEICAAALSRAAGAPVAMSHEREEVFYAHRGRHAVTMRLKSAHRADGTLTALDLNALLDTGAYASFGVVTTWYVGAFGGLPYPIPHYRFRAASLYTNTPPAGPKRGHGALQPRFAIECQLDEAARELGLDPIEMRLKQLAPAGYTSPGGLTVTSTALAACIERVAEASGWRARRGTLGPDRGLGFACSVYMSGAAHSIYKTDAPHSTVQVQLHEGGRCTVRCGTAEIGQGSTTVLAAVVGEVLGIPLGAIDVVEGDTGETPVDLGSYSSRVTFMCGNAALSAATALRRRLEAAASTLPGAGLTDPEVIALAARSGPLVAEGSYTPPARAAPSAARGRARRRPTASPPRWLRSPSTGRPARSRWSASGAPTTAARPSTSRGCSARSRAASTWATVRPSWRPCPTARALGCW